MDVDRDGSMEIELIPIETNRRKHKITQIVAVTSAHRYSN